MNKIPTSEIKKLRDITGAGFLDCKEALEKSDFNIDNAIDYLRKKGISTAQKKGDRAAKEGLIAISTNDTNKEASIIEVNSETDFVARNSDFQSFVSRLSELNLEHKGNMDNLLNSKYNNDDKVSEALTNTISKIGENITIKRSDYINVEDGFIGTYLHNVEKDNMGKIGVILSISTNCDKKNIDDFLKKICMHIAASNPIALSSTEINDEILKKEKEFQLEEINKEEKPEEIKKKMLEGKMKKFFADVVLLDQKFIMDDTINVSEFISNSSKELNCDIKINKFVRFKVGEDF